MGQEPVEQLVGGCLQVGAAQRVDAVFQPEVAAGPVARLEQADGVEDQPVARAHRERGRPDAGMQAQRCRVRGGGQCLQVAVAGQPQRRRVPAVDELQPAARVEFGEHGGDEVLVFCGPRH
jgi:hypothetical protein